jgi:NDP-sugar pyrophosphorylase family protein
MLILAGGLNSRMGPLAGTIYKAFLPIQGLSCVARHVIRASAYGVTEIDALVDSNDPVLDLLATEGVPEQLHGVPSPTVRVLECPGSPADKIRWWCDRRALANRALVVLGDTLAAVDLAHLWRCCDSSQFDSAIAVATARLPFGVVLVDGDHVTQFKANPDIELLVNTGHMALGQYGLNLLRAGLELEPALAKIAEAGKLRAVVSTGTVMAVDSLGSLASAHQSLEGAVGQQDCGSD